MLKTLCCWYVSACYQEKLVMSPALKWVVLIVLASPNEHLCKKLLTIIGKLQVQLGLYQNQTVHWLHTALHCNSEYIGYLPKGNYHPLSNTVAKVLALLKRAVSIVRSGGKWEVTKTNSTSSIKLCHQSGNNWKERSSPSKRPLGVSTTLCLVFFHNLSCTELVLTNSAFHGMTNTGFYHQNDTCSLWAAKGVAINNRFTRFPTCSSFRKSSQANCFTDCLKYKGKQ